MKKNISAVIISAIILLFDNMNCYSQDYYSLGSNAYYSGNDTLAIRYFGLAINKNQNLPLSYMMRGAARAFRGEYSKAYSDLSVSIKLDSNNAKAYYYYGKVYLIQGLYYSAIQYYEISISKNDRDPAVYDDRAICKLYSKDIDGAIKDENTAIRLNPTESNYYNARGYIKLKAGRYKEAILDFDSSLKIKVIPKAYANKGLALYFLNDYEAAILLFTKALELSGDDSEVLYYRGLSFNKIGNVDSACKDLRRSIELGYSEAKNILKCVE
jgi:tetratricopeptide (TPR) repeat protein